MHTRRNEMQYWLYGVDDDYDGYFQFKQYQNETTWFISRAARNNNNRVQSILWSFLFPSTSTTITTTTLYRPTLHGNFLSVKWIKTYIYQRWSIKSGILTSNIRKTSICTTSYEFSFELKLLIIWLMLNVDSISFRNLNVGNFKN